MRILALHIIFVFLSGCSTVMTQYSGHKGDEWVCDPEDGFTSIYSGTKFNAKCISGNYDNVAFFCIVDFPLSLVVDTFILPYTIYTETSGAGFCQDSVHKNNR